MTILQSTYSKTWLFRIFSCTAMMVLYEITILFSQTPNHKIFFDHYGPQHGFNSSQALSIGKTSDGFLWIGTDLGLMRYDGHQFISYLHEENNDQSITGDYIRYLKVDKYDRIWMDAGEKLCVFDWRNKKMYTPDLPSKSIKPDRYKFFYQAEKDRMWFTTNEGVFYNDGYTLDINELKINNSKSRNYLDMAVDEANGIWLISLEGLMRYQDDSESVIHYQYDSQALGEPSDNITLFIDDHFIWIGCWVNGLIRLDKKTQSQKKFAWQDVTKFQNGILDIQASGIKGDEDNLWLATTSGILTFNKRKEEFTNYFSENNYDHFKINGSGFAFLPTLKDGFWIGTYKGLHRYDPKKQLIKQKKLTINDTYQNYVIDGFCLQKGRRDSIAYLRYYYGDVVKYDLVNDKVLPLPEKLKKYCESKREIYHIFLDKDDRLWLTSRLDGLVIYHTKSHQLVIPENARDFKKEKVIFDIVQNSKGRIYLAGINKLFQYDEMSNTVKEMEGISALLRKDKMVNYINNVSLDAEDNIWFVSKEHGKNEDRIVKYDVQNHELINLKSNDPKVNKILNHVESLKCQSGKKLYISSQSGLFEYDESSNIFKDLALSKTRYLEMGSGSDVWTSTNLGISKIDVQNGIVTNFTYLNSPIGQLPHPLIIKSPNEENLWITQKGMLNLISLADFIKGGKDSIQLTDIEIKNTKLPKGKLPEVLNLKHHQNEINLRFSIFNFTNSIENIYHYNLNDEGWKMMKGNELTFQELSYGEYQLEVRAYNSFGIPSANNYKMRFVIKPPFWRSMWFNVLIILSIGFGIYTLFRYREKQRLKLEKLRFSIARDLHDDLGSNLSQIKLISEIEAMKNHTSKFTEIALKLEDVMQNMKEIVWSINPKYDQLEEVVAKIQEFAIQTLESKGINLKFSIDEIPKSMKLSPEDKRNYYLIFKEAIHNIVKYANAENVYFFIKSNGKSLVTGLQDDGIGFDKNLSSEGNGLKNMKARAHAMKAELTITTSNDGTRIELVI